MTLPSDRFLSIVSHELRSPLNSIQNWSSVIEAQLGRDAPPSLRRALIGIKQGVEQQVRLLNDLIDASRIMSGKIELATALVTVQPLVQEVLADFADQARAQGIELRFAATALSLQVRGDAQRLQQILRNLLSNALKFSTVGGQVQVRLHAQAAELCLSVTDQGVGIAPDLLPQVFDGFARLEGSGQPGLGLGLAIVRRLCELHGGRISASSGGIGQGARFEVCLPLVVGGS